MRLSVFAWLTAAVLCLAAPARAEQPEENPDAPPAVETGDAATEPAGDAEAEIDAEEKRADT